MWGLIPDAETALLDGFLVLHFAGGAYALVTLALAWLFRLLLQLVMGSLPLFGVWRVPWIVVPIGLALVVVLAAVEVQRTLKRWRRREPEPDVGLRVRAFVYVAMACLFGG